MDIDGFGEMQRLLDLACAGPATAEGRAALEDAARMWRDYTLCFRKGLDFAASIPDDDRQAMADLVGPYLQRCMATIIAQ